MQWIVNAMFYPIIKYAMFCLIFIIGLCLITYEIAQIFFGGDK